MSEKRNGRYELFQGEIQGQLSQMEEERRSTKRRRRGRIGILGILFALGLVLSIAIRFWMGV